MKLNKKFSALTLTASAVLLLAACGGNTNTNTGGASSEAASSAAASSAVESSSVAAGELQDGTYKLVEKNLDENGWKTDFSIVVKDGKITESNYENLNDKGEKKTEDEGYETAMKDKTGVGPQEYIPQLNSELVEKQDPAAVEVVTGATHSSESFKEYAQKLVDAAKEGNTETIEIDN